MRPFVLCAPSSIHIYWPCTELLSLLQLMQVAYGHAHMTLLQNRSADQLGPYIRYLILLPLYVIYFTDSRNLQATCLLSLFLPHISVLAKPSAALWRCYLAGNMSSYGMLQVEWKNKYEVSWLAERGTNIYLFLSCTWLEECMQHAGKAQVQPIVGYVDLRPNVIKNGKICINYVNMSL